MVLNSLPVNVIQHTTCYIYLFCCSAKCSEMHFHLITILKATVPNNNTNPYPRRNRTGSFLQFLVMNIKPTAQRKDEKPGPRSPKWFYLRNMKRYKQRAQPDCSSLSWWTVDQALLCWGQHTLRFNITLGCWQA